MLLTATVTALFVTAIHAIGIFIAAPAEGNAVAVFTLELISVTFHITAILKRKKMNCFHYSTSDFKPKSSIRS